MLSRTLYPPGTTATQGAVPDRVHHSSGYNDVPLPVPPQSATAPPQLGRLLSPILCTLIRVHLSSPDCWYIQNALPTLVLPYIRARGHVTHGYLVVTTSIPAVIWDYPH